MAALAHRRQILALELGAPKQRYRAGAKTLQGEGEVGETVMPGEYFAAKADGPHVDLFRPPAIGGRHHRLEPARLTERAHERAAAAIDVGVIDERGDLS